MKLNAWNMSDGAVEIHKAGCSHNPASGRKSSRLQEQVEFGKTDWVSQFEFAHDYWDNGILEEHEADNGVGSFDVFAEMDFKPCTMMLPTGGPAVAMGIAGKAEEAHQAAAKRTKLEVRRVARAKMFEAIRIEINTAIDEGDDPELVTMMIEQAQRVAVMFGLHHDKGFSVTGR